MILFETFDIRIPIISFTPHFKLRKTSPYIEELIEIPCNVVLSFKAFESYKVTSLDYFQVDSDRWPSIIVTHFLFDNVFTPK